MNGERRQRHSDIESGLYAIEEMNRIRNTSDRHVVSLHEEAQRMLDWREHIKARPLVAVAVVAAGGFLLMHRRSPKCPEVVVHESQREGNRKVAKASIASGAMALVGSLASQALRQYAMNYFHTTMGKRHDRRSDDASTPVGAGQSGISAYRPTTHRYGNGSER
jgi:hypothetical protein